MSSRTSIAVIMSTYNGQRFVAEQIESILDQVGVDVHLYIRDDGSLDSTKSILATYEDNSKVRVEYGAHLGIGTSFMHLLWSVPDTFDYYAFSDQDDIWMQDKLACAIQMLEGESGTLYSSNLACAGTDMRYLGLRFDLDDHPCETTLSLIGRNRFYGCTQVFDNRLFKLLCCRRPTEELLHKWLHDEWVSVSASIAGRIAYDSMPHICYRRHGGNYTNFGQQNFIGIWRRRLRKLVRPSQRKPRSVLAREVLRCYSDYLQPDDKELLEVLAHTQEPRNRVRLVKDIRNFKSSRETDFWFTLKATMGIL